MRVGMVHSLNKLLANLQYNIVQSGGINAISINNTQIVNSCTFLRKRTIVEDCITVLQTIKELLLEKSFIRLSALFLYFLCLRCMVFTSAKQDAFTGITTRNLSLTRWQWFLNRSPEEHFCTPQSLCSLTIHSPLCHLFINFFAFRYNKGVIGDAAKCWLCNKSLALFRHFAAHTFTLASPSGTNSLQLSQMCLKHACE